MIKGVEKNKKGELDMNSEFWDDIFRYKEEVNEKEE